MRWMDIPEPILGLAPMADFTDLPFCRTVRSFGGNPVIFREMVSAEALVRDNRRTLDMCRLDPIERPVVQQLFGSDPDSMARAAALIEENFSPDGIDINMGCPVHKAVSQFNGASLMREPDKARAIIQAVKRTIRVPLSVKTRLGWSNPDEILEFFDVLQDAGADAVEIHARTKTQGYSGKADWSAVRPITQKAKITVLINGDITDPESAKQALEESGAQGVLIGRGALGRPWIFERISHTLQSGTDAGEPSLAIRLTCLHRHAVMQLEHFGPHGLTKLRKHYPWYFKGVEGFRKYRSEAVKIETLEDLDKLIESIAA